MVFPVHPRTRKMVELPAVQKMLENGDFLILEPLAYLEFMAMVKSAKFLITDSGGIQEETTFMGVPCFTLRPNTERPITIDGNLDEFAKAVATPVEYFHPDEKNRAAQFLYHWDDQAFYVGLRTLDTKTFSPQHPLWEGDAVEWYFDTRRGKNFLRNEWTTGAVHCFWTAMELDQLNPRFCLRPGYLDAIPKIGIEVATKRTEDGLNIEFKLPWENFPDFAAKSGEVIGMDVELSYSDGAARSDRSFVFGSPLSVTRPANLAAVRLVEKLEPSDWKQAGAVMMPVRVDTPWGQSGLPQVSARIAMPVNHSDKIGRVDFRLTDLAGNEIGMFAATEEERFHPDGEFVRRVAQWPASLVTPGGYHVTAIVYDQEGGELTRVSPRLVSVNMQQGY